MNTYHGLIKLLLDPGFFEDHAAYARTVLPRPLLGLYDAIEYGHKEYEGEITVDELEAMYLSLNPSLTRAAKAELDKVFEDIRTADISDVVGTDLIKKLWVVKQAEKVANVSLAIAEGVHDDWETLEELVVQGKEGRIVADVDDTMPAVTTDIAELFAQLKTENKWRFNLPVLDEVVGQFGPGHLIILAARTEVGKTGAWVSFTFADKGWLDQGAIVHAVTNEEPANRTMMRGVSATTGLTEEELEQRIPFAQAVFDKVKDRAILRDAVGMTLAELSAYVKTHKPDILVVDQADKININDNNLKDHLKLKHIYVGLREIAKLHKCAVLAITQLSADANHKLYVSMADMEGSKTAKQAEADLIICIGMNDPAHNEGVDTGYRMLNVGKNKLKGIKAARGAMLDYKTSRFTA